MKPKWMRNHIGCPDCGRTITIEMPEAQCCNEGVPFDCTRCGAHYAHEDFWKEHEFKNGFRTPLTPNHR